jgi:hypothetical protein
MVILNPVKIIISNYPENKTEELDAINNPEDAAMGTRKVPFGKVLYIEREDFMENPPKNFFRLAPGREVRLRYAYFIKCEKVIKDNNGEIKELGENWLNDYNVSIINCGGKMEFPKYAKILKKLEIPYFIMADFDFLIDGISRLRDEETEEIIKKVEEIIRKIGDNREDSDGDKVRELAKKFVDELISEGILPELKSDKKRDVWRSISKVIDRYSNLPGCGIKHIEQIVDEELKKEILDILKELKEKHIFILTGELEDFYIEKPRYDKEAGVIEIIGKSMSEAKPITEYVRYEEFYELLKLFVEKCLNLKIVE